jgi:hypothetical protein
VVNDVQLDTPARLLAAWRAMAQVWGWTQPAITLAGLTALSSVGAFGQAIDRARGYDLSATPLDRPIFIAGNPRTGSTFLHRELTGLGLGVGRQLWEQVLPSLTLQRALAGWIPQLDAISPVRHHHRDAHETSLEAVETDDAGLLFGALDGMFLYGFFLAWSEHPPVDAFDPRRRDNSARDHALWAANWRRSLIRRGAPGARVVAKSFSAGASLGPLFRSFPDARVVYLARDPGDAIPSALSLITGVLHQRFGYDHLPEALRHRHARHLADALLTLLSRFDEDWRAGAFPTESVLVVPYPDLVERYDEAMARVADHCGLTLTAAQVDAVACTADAQRARVSPHRYDGGRFGLDPEALRDAAPFAWRAPMSLRRGEPR